PACSVILGAIEVLRQLNSSNMRSVPEQAPTSFIRRRWQPHVFTSEGINRRFYELCVLSELSNALRSGDLWVVGSRQFKDFDEYLLPTEAFKELRLSGLPIAVTDEAEAYVERRRRELHEALTVANALAAGNQLPDASIEDGTLKIKPLEKTVPDAVPELLRRA